MTDQVDDRIVCTSCRHCDAEGQRCRKLQRFQMVGLPRRCTFFLPNPEEGDQRTGEQRYPNFETSITKAREEDAAHRKANG